MNSTQYSHVLRCNGDICNTAEEELIREEPLLIRVEGRPYSVVMRTPGQEISQVAGFCLTEGIVDHRTDFATIDYCEESDSNVVNVRLQPARLRKVSTLLERRGFISQTSCGICGKEMIKDLFQLLRPMEDETAIDIGQAIACVDKLGQCQDLYKRTRAAHAAILLDLQMNVLAMGEDVGRHNALDKAIGKVFMSRQMENTRLAVLSSRISYELVQKAARARLPVVIGMSRPTALAVELGQDLNMSLACIDRKSGLMVFSGEERFSGR